MQAGVVRTIFSSRFWFKTSGSKQLPIMLHAFGLVIKMLLAIAGRRNGTRERERFVVVCANERKSVVAVAGDWRRRPSTR